MYRKNDKSAATKETKKYLYTLSQTTYPYIRRTTVDGIYDAETRDAVTDFQRAMSLEETGVVDYETFDNLYREYRIALGDQNANRVIYSDDFPLSIGDTNEAVRILHIYINELSKTYSCINYVGTSNYYSEDTANAILSLSRVFMMKETKITDLAMMERIIYDANNRALMF